MADHAHRSNRVGSRKRCPSCNAYKPISDFPRNRASKDGLATYCKPCHNRICADNRKKHHGSTRNFHLKRRYGVDVVTVEWLILQQGGLCAVCKTGKAEHVDHDHRTKSVRGILCFNCNRGLGKFGDDLGRMRRAIDYLRRTRATA